MMIRINWTIQIKCNNLVLFANHETLRERKANFFFLRTFLVNYKSLSSLTAICLEKENNFIEFIELKIEKAHYVVG